MPRDEGLACFDLVAVACVWFLLRDPESKSAKPANHAARASPALAGSPIRKRQKLVSWIAGGFDAGPVDRMCSGYLCWKNIEVDSGRLFAGSSQLA